MTEWIRETMENEANFIVRLYSEWMMSVSLSGKKSSQCANDEAERPRLYITISSPRKQQ